MLRKVFQLSAVVICYPQLLEAFLVHYTTVVWLSGFVKCEFMTVYCQPLKNNLLYWLQDLTCIVWDLSKLTYVRQLSQHMAPITAIAINDLTVG